MKPIEIVSLDFLVLTLTTLAVYYLLSPRAQTYWLLAVSCFFYATWSSYFLATLLAFTILNYVLARQIERSQSRALFLLGIVIDAGSLIALKLLTGPYQNTLLERIHATALTGILLPIGFSFYILQLISYLTDVSRGQIEAERDFVQFALYTFYFPKLLAGPIERARNFLPQLKRERVVNRGSVEQGAYLILLGLVRKVVIADHLSMLRPADIFTAAENYTSLERFVWLFVFAFILYNDFAGYTSIVRGISCLLGIQLSANFRQPFLARSFSDFWTRWHITLSEWLRDYIFYPARRWLMSLPRGGWMALILPPLLTMLVSGFWHGASLALLGWGFLHGSYLVVEQFLQRFKMLPKAGFGAQLYSIVVFLLVTLAWIPFNTPSLRAAARYLVGLLLPYSASFQVLIWPDILLLTILSLWLDWQEGRHQDSAFPRRWPAAAQSWCVAIAVILLFFFTSVGSDLSRFVYQFF
jgi:D-alanyl-lipoteichoic acid acyltransferase DltB (MBOAT superfamily)